MTSLLFIIGGGILAVAVVAILTAVLLKKKGTADVSDGEYKPIGESVSELARTIDVDVEAATATVEEPVADATAPIANEIKQTEAEGEAAIPTRNGDRSLFGQMKRSKSIKKINRTISSLMSGN